MVALAIAAASLTSSSFALANAASATFSSGARVSSARWASSRALLIATVWQTEQRREDQQVATMENGKEYAPALASCERRTLVQ